MHIIFHLIIADQLQAEKRTGSTEKKWSAIESAVCSGAGVKAVESTAECEWPYARQGLASDAHHFFCNQFYHPEPRFFIHLFTLYFIVVIMHAELLLNVSTVIFRGGFAPWRRGMQTAPDHPGSRARKKPDNTRSAASTHRYCRRNHGLFSSP